MNLSVELPVNVVGVPNLSSIGTLSENGTRRVSMAVLLYKAMSRPHFTCRFWELVLKKVYINPRSWL